MQIKITKAIFSSFVGRNGNCLMVPCIGKNSTGAQHAEEMKKTAASPKDTNTPIPEGDNRDPCCQAPTCEPIKKLGKLLRKHQPTWSEWS